MMHHNTKFGNKMFGSLAVIIWKNINILTLHCDFHRTPIIWTNINILTLHCDFDPECSNPVFFTGHSDL